MDDFSFPDMLSQFDLPPSPRNFPRPGKRPMSSMSPSILTDQDGAARLVIGELSLRVYSIDLLTTFSCENRNVLKVSPC